MTPTARSLAHLRKRGYLAAVVEKRLPRGFITVDMFGFVDIVALKDGVTLAIQATSNNGGNVSARLAKIRASEHLPRVLAAGWQVRVWGWSKRGARGKRKVWTLREEVVTG